MAKGTRILNRGSKVLNQTGPGAGRIKSVPTNLRTKLRGTENPGGGIDIGVRVRGRRRS